MDFSIYGNLFKVCFAAQNVVITGKESIETLMNITKKYPKGILGIGSKFSSDQNQK